MSEFESTGASPGEGPTLSIPSLLQSAAAAGPDRVALLAVGRKPATYRALYRQVGATVEALRSFGIGRDDRVAVILPNGPEMAAAFLGTAAAAACAPLNPGYREREFEFYLTDLQARAIVVPAGADSPSVDVARSLGIRVIRLSAQPDAEAGCFTLSCEEAVPTCGDHGSAQPDDLALLLHTSGTTARPKMVPLTQRNLCLSAARIAGLLEFSDNDRCLNVMPLFHVHGLVGALLSSIAAGASVVCTPGFLAPQFLQWLEEFRPTWYTAVPSIHQSVLARLSMEGPS